MLIEAQAQKLLSEQEKPGDDNGNKPDAQPMDVDEVEPKEPVKSESGDVEMGESDEQPPEEPTPKKSEADEKPIDIDPKTFCKLGHFHLLLEDYSKGKRRTFVCILIRILINLLRNGPLQLFRLIKSIALFVTIIGRTRRFFTA